MLMKLPLNIAKRLAQLPSLWNTPTYPQHFASIVVKNAIFGLKIAKKAKNGSFLPKIGKFRDLGYDAILAHCALAFTIGFTGKPSPVIVTR